MSRWRRQIAEGVPQHVLNRGAKKGTIFHQDIDNVDFLELLADAAERYPIDLIAFSLMKTHFHLIVKARSGGSVSAYMQWLMNAHIRQYRRRYSGVGEGHIYQGRYRNIPLPGYDDLVRVTRYVEANALTAGLVERAEEHRWCSLATVVTPSGRTLVSADAFPRPATWLDYVNGGMTKEEQLKIEYAIDHGLPLERVAVTEVGPVSITRAGRPPRVKRWLPRIIHPDA